MHKRIFPYSFITSQGGGEGGLDPFDRMLKESLKCWPHTWPKCEVRQPQHVQGHQADIYIYIYMGIFIYLYIYIYIYILEIKARQRRAKRNMYFMFVASQMKVAHP